jgi:hypothetical protein
MAISVPSITEEWREQKFQLLNTVEMKRLRRFSQIRKCARGESLVRIDDVGPDFTILLAGSEEIALMVVGRLPRQATGYPALQVEESGCSCGAGSRVQHAALSYGLYHSAFGCGAYHSRPSAGREGRSCWPDSAISFQKSCADQGTSSP